MDKTDLGILKHIVVTPAFIGYLLALVSAATEVNFQWPFIEINLTNQTFFEINLWKWATFSALWLAKEILCIRNWEVWE